MTVRKKLLRNIEEKLAQEKKHKKSKNLIATLRVAPSFSNDYRRFATLRNTFALNNVENAVMAG